MMPDPYERHGRNSWEWSTFPARSQQRAAAASDDPAHKAPPSKQKKGKCKGPDGWHEEHDLVFVRDELDRSRPQSCGWGPGGWLSLRGLADDPVWHCGHDEVCSQCGHVERPYYMVRKSGDCPDFHGQPVPEGVLAQIAEARRRAEEWRAQRAARLAISPGKKGYRKKGKDKT